MDLNLEKSELIQNLWGGYGELLRVQIDGHSYILKKITLPNIKEELQHPRGWATEFSNNRKIKSYLVESYWYEHYLSHIDDSRTPKLIKKNSPQEESQWLLLEDLREAGFHSKSAVTEGEAYRCLNWFAQFHRQYIGAKPEGLWEIGTYWHLNTRPEELEKMSDIELKDAAPDIDKKLNSAKYQTIIHGDGKLANFMFNETSVAAVDFQYIGGGIGLKDIVLFLSSLYREEELFHEADKCIDYYFQQLNLLEVEAEWRELLPFVWADFYRFLQGWYPDHARINNYSKQMKDKALSCL